MKKKYFKLIDLSTQSSTKEKYYKTRIGFFSLIGKTKDNLKREKKQKQKQKR